MRGGGYVIKPPPINKRNESPTIKLKILTSRKKQFQQQEKKQVLAWKGFMLQLMLLLSILIHNKL